MASATPDGFPARPLVFFGLRAGAGAATDSSLARILALRRGCCGAGGGDGVGGGGGSGERIAGGDFFGGDGDFAGEVAIPGDAGWGGGGRIGARRRPSWPVRAGSWMVASAARTHLRGIAGGTTLAAAEGEAGAKLIAPLLGTSSAGMLGMGLLAAASKMAEAARTRRVLFFVGILVVVMVVWKCRR
jgi:hypothetical protein